MVQIGFDSKETLRHIFIGNNAVRLMTWKVR